ncbi:MAG TPA: ABC transporter permease [Marmoricola sp.]|nr:ABC transporter permease [Marmoricola sp.]
MIPWAAAPTTVDNCLTRNEWICGAYYSSRAGELGQALLQHLGIVVASVLLGLAVAFPLALLARRYRRVEGIVVGATTAVYTIPSLALFSLLVPLTGLGVETVVIGLGLYSLTILVRGMVDGFRGVPADVRESASGMGYGPGRQLFRVELPLATPTIMGALRVATVSTVALTTVGAILDEGGLGDLLVEGQLSDFKAQVLATSVLCVLLAIVLDLLLVGTQRLLTPWTRRPVT